MARPPDPPPDLPADALVHMVEELDEKIQRILEAHCLTENEAETLVYETMVAVGHRWHRLTDPNAYFLDTLERICAQADEDETETPS